MSLNEVLEHPKAGRGQIELAVVAAMVSLLSEDA
jgi:hypothetical protein